MIDVHTHVLPNMDDGSKSVEESLSMLRSIYADGISTVVATPHFYAWEESIDDFLRRRADANMRLFDAIATDFQAELPKVLLGAEVAYFSGMGKCDQISSLCMEGTDIILLELPFAKWDSEMFRDVEELQRKQKVTVMLAHLERYWCIRENRSWIDDILNSNILVQVSVDALTDWWMRRRVVRWGKLGYIDAFGSDAHNILSRKPQWAENLSVMEKHGILTKI